MLRVMCSSFEGRRCIIYGFAILISYFFPKKLNAADIYDSRSAGMCGLSVLQRDGWSLFNNLAGIAWDEKLATGIHYQNPFLLPQTGTKALFLTVPAGHGNFGAGYLQYGYSLYQEGKALLSYARRFGNKYSAGIGMNYHYVTVGGDYGNSGYVTADAGFIARPVDVLLLGFHVHNPWHTTIKGLNNEMPVSLINTGIGYIFKETFTGIEIEKNINRPAIIKVAVEQLFVDHYFFRAGVSSGDNQYSFGTGFLFSRFRLDIAFMAHRYLGYSPYFSFFFLPGK